MFRLLYIHGDPLMTKIGRPCRNLLDSVDSSLARFRACVCPGI